MGLQEHQTSKAWNQYLLEDVKHMPLLLASETLLVLVYWTGQGSRGHLEICVNQHETCILRQWHEKCIHDNLKLMYLQSQNDGVTGL